jgi:hypothetical protein
MGLQPDLPVRLPGAPASRPGAADAAAGTELLRAHVRQLSTFSSPCRFACGLLDELAGRRHADLATALILTFAPPALLQPLQRSLEESIYPFLHAMIFAAWRCSRRRGDPARCWR